MIHLTPTNLAEALLWSALAGALAWAVLAPLRRRSVAGLLAALVVTGAAASTGCLWGAIHGMLLPEIGWPTMTAVTALSTAVVGGAAAAVGHRLSRDHRALRRAVAEVGAGRVPVDDGARLPAELQCLRTELRETAEALAATRERERALESARRDLVSWISHDLRTPLAGLRAMAEALEDGVADDPTRYHRQITASVDRLTTMVEDLFDLSRLQAGAPLTDTASVALDDLVSDCVGALAPLATAHGVRLSGSVAERVAVLGNGAELNRALSNLVVNAIRHTGPSGRVEIRVGRAADPAARAEVAEVLVVDQCGGIDPGHLARVFEVGFRGEAARTPHADRHPAGAGLGLAITRGIVEAHDGTVDVANTADGCRFRLLLPAAS